jgi:thiamine-phosphate pyrophosphorylase
VILPDRPELPQPCLMLVTDRRRCGARTMEGIVAEAIAGGVNVIQLREPDLSALELWEMARTLVIITRARGALLLVNDRIDVALAVAADGVQLSGHSLPPEIARQVAGSRLLLGRSVHSEAEVVVAEREGADFVVLGTIFMTGSHPDRSGAGPELVRAARSNARLPIIGIGGITVGNARSVMEAGADGVAVISAILDAPNPREAAAELLAAVTLR